MKQALSPGGPNTQLHVLLADDDRDDRFFFSKILRGLPIQTQLATVENGEQLMAYLNENSEKLPDVLFLDLNMPRKNGSECLSEIKHSQKLKDIPVIIYSTSGHTEGSVDLYSKGAHYYFRKTNLSDTKAILHHVLNLLLESGFTRPPREKFVLTPAKEKALMNKM